MEAASLHFWANDFAPLSSNAISPIVTMVLT